MNDVSGNTFSDTVSEVFEEDHGTGEENKTEENDISGNSESTEEDEGVASDSESDSESDFEYIEGEPVENGENEYISETVVNSDDSLSDPSHIENYLSFLIAVVIGFGCIICWAKGFTE